MERLWRTVKREYRYLNQADDEGHLSHQLSVCIAYYNHQRPNQSLRGQTLAKDFVKTFYSWDLR